MNAMEETKQYERRRKYKRDKRRRQSQKKRLCGQKKVLADELHKIQVEKEALQATTSKLMRYGSDETLPL